MLILTGVLLASGCGSESQTPRATGQLPGIDPAPADPATTAEPTMPMTPVAGTPPDTDPKPTPAEPNSDDMSEADPDPDMSQTDSDPDTSQTDPDPDMGQADPDPDMGQADPDPDMGQADPDPDTEPAPLRFATDIWPLWSMDRDPVFVYRGLGSYSGCADETAPCHGSQSPGAGLSMADVDTAYAQMIDTTSVSGLCAGTQRVAVGDPDNSCLILFYVGRLGREDLDWVDDAEIELMREWIRQGALP